jgi:hypothetical protein
MPETARSAQRRQLRLLTRVIAFVLVATDLSVFLVLSMEFVYPAVAPLPTVEPVAVGTALLFLVLFAVPQAILLPTVTYLLDF